MIHQKITYEALLRHYSSDIFIDLDYLKNQKLLFIDICFCILKKIDFHEFHIHFDLIHRVFFLLFDFNYYYPFFILPFIFIYQSVFIKFVHY